jgi:hypothetical protein
MRRTRTTIAAIVIVVVIVVLTAAHVVGIVVTAPATLILTWSHDTFEVLMHVLSIYRSLSAFRDPLAF